LFTLTETHAPVGTPHLVHTLTHAWAPTLGKPTGTGIHTFPTTGTFKQTRLLTIPTPTQAALGVKLLIEELPDDEVEVLRSPTTLASSEFNWDEMVRLLVV
jgi:hypothetical protein